MPIVLVVILLEQVTEMIAVNEVDMFYDEEEGEENYQIQGWNERGELKSIKLSEASTINAK